MPLDLDALRAKKARRSSNGWSAKEGDNVVRFLPHTSAYFKVTIAEIDYQFRSHFLKSEGVDTAVIRCPRDGGLECSVCAFQKSNKDTQDPILKKVLDQIRVGERHLFNLLNMNDIGAGIQPYETGPKLYDDVLAYCANPNWGDLVNPQTGRNFSIILTPQGKSRSGYNEYQLQPHPKEVDILALLPAGWVEKLDELEANIPAYPDAALLSRWADILGFRLPGTAQVAVPAAIPAAPIAYAPPAPPAPLAPPAPVAYAPPVAPAPVAYSPPAPPAPPAAPPAPYNPPAVVAPVVTPQTPALPATATGTTLPPSAVTTFCATVGLTPQVKASMPPADKDNQPVSSVPHCYSEGQARTDIGFNPMKWPCERGCPVKAPCQLKQLGLG